MKKDVPVGGNGGDEHRVGALQGEAHVPHRGDARLAQSSTQHRGVTIVRKTTANEWCWLHEYLKHRL